VVLATVVSAQTLPVPTLPPEPPPDVETATPSQEPPGTEAGGAPGTVSASHWEYGLSVGVGYDSNISFRLPDGPSSRAILSRGRLARVFTGPNGRLRLAGTGSWNRYFEASTLNRYNAGLSLDGSHRSSLDTAWQAGASYDLGYSDSSQILSDQGVLLPLVRTRTATGRLGVTRRLGERTSFRLHGRISRVEFDQQDVGARGLVDGQSLRGTAALERTLGQRDSAAIEYSLGATLARQAPTPGGGDGHPYYFTHYGSLQWNHVLSRRSAFVLEGGASYTPEAETAGVGRRVSFYGGAAYSRQVKRSDLMLFVRREVTPAFGLGVSRIQTRFGLAATIPMGRAWTLRIRGTHIVLETPEGAAFTYGTPDEASASLSRSLGRHFAVSGEGRYRRRGAAGAIPAIDGYQVGIFLSLGGPSGPGSGGIPRL